MNNRWLERLGDGPIVTDGAMGTLLYGRGVSPDAACERMNLDEPALIDDIHRSYLRAGAELIETNTYGANCLRLGRFDLAKRVSVINRRGAEIAVRARDRYRPDAFVGGSVGPIGEPLAPVGRITLEEALAAFVEQIDAAFVERGDLLTAARRPSAGAARLSDLYIQRAYKLHHQQYADLIDIENQIRDLEAETAHE